MLWHKTVLDFKDIRPKFKTSTHIRDKYSYVSAKTNHLYYLVNFMTKKERTRNNKTYFQINMHAQICVYIVSEYVMRPWLTYSIFL